MQFPYTQTHKESGRKTINRLAFLHAFFVRIPEKNLRANWLTWQFAKMRGNDYAARTYAATENTGRT